MVVTLFYQLGIFLCKTYGNRKLNAKGAILKASGASSIQATVTELLKANSSGASSIDYKGNPNVKESNTSGASSIRHKN